MFKTKNIKLNIALNCIRTGISVLFPFLTFQIASRVIFAENLGKVTFSNSIINYFILIAGLGISQYAIRESGNYRSDSRDMCRFASEMFSVNLISTVISILALIVFFVFSEKLHDYSMLIFIQSFTILSSLFSMDWVNVVYEDYSFITIRTLIFQTITLLLTFLFVKQVEDYILFAVITVLGKVGPDILNWFYIKKKYLKVRIAIHMGLFSHFKPIFIIFFNALVITIYVNFDTTMIGLMCDDTSVGFYSVSVKVYTALKTVFSAVISVIISRMSLYISTNKTKEADQTISSLLNNIFICVIPLIVFIVLNSYDIIVSVFGAEYILSVLPLQILSYGVFFSVFASIITNCIFLPLKMEKYSLIATSFSAVSNCILNLFFIKVWGISGAAITTVIAEFTVLIIAYVFMKKKKLSFFSKLNFKTLLNSFIICLGLISSFYFISRCFSNSLLSVIIQFLIFCFMLLLAWKKTVIGYLKSIKK